MRKIAAVLALSLAFAVPLGTRTAIADSDRHYNYPVIPAGESAIRRTFGSPCNSSTRANSLNWTAADNGRSYRVNYHRLLGGSSSSNVPDVRYHFRAQGMDGTVKRGIWGYNCRRISNSSKYSTHAWGIAIDINSAYEHVGHTHCHTVTPAMAALWKTHNWTWGAAFNDCMHFQYATAY